MTHTPETSGALVDDAIKTDEGALRCILSLKPFLTDSFNRDLTQELHDYVAKRFTAIARPADGWIPIESAPKDGTLFLCWVSAERWSQEDGGGSGRSADTSEVDFCQWRENDGHGYFMNMMGQIGDAQDVTHWMPLPASPIAASPSPPVDLGGG